MFGINYELIYEGIKIYVESKGVKILYLILFKLKGCYLVWIVKINVLLNCLEMVEVLGFWFDGVYCCKWYSECEWDFCCD